MVSIHVGSTDDLCSPVKRKLPWLPRRFYEGVCIDEVIIDGKHFIELTHNLAGLVVNLESPGALGWPLGHRQHLALAFRFAVLGTTDHAQCLWCRRPIWTPQHRPNRGVLAAKPPQRVTGRPMGVSGVDFIEGR